METTSTVTTEYYIDTFNSFDNVLYRTVLEILGVRASMNGIVDGELRSIRYFLQSEQEVKDAKGLFEAYLPEAKKHQGYLDSMKQSMEQMDAMFEQLNNLD